MAPQPPPLVATIPVEERIGLAFIVEAAALSTFAPLALMIYLIYSAAKESLVSKDPLIPSSRTRYFRSHLHYYFISLLFADTIQGLGGFMDLKWVSQGNVTGGAFCTAQGALKQVGDVGVALSILAITVHTFLVLFFHWTPPESPRMAIVVLTLDWLFITLLVSIGYALHGRHEYYGITGLWCWITALYPVERIALEYFWLWAAALLNVLLYIPLFLALRGNIVVVHSDPYGGWPKVSFRTTTKGLAWARPRDIKVHMLRRLTLRLSYPLIYLITILPTSITRFMSFAGHNVPYQATVFCGLLFSCSGIFNVILFTTTRPMLLPHTAPPPRELTTMSFRRTAGGTTALTEPFEPSASTVTARTGMNIADPQVDGELFPWHKSESPQGHQEGDPEQIELQRRPDDADTASIRSSKLGSIIGAAR
ncbi:hypothetical protein EXIGLDRAFT_779314 [Exidia glandulosa HHB12029]|uniref:Uncharacterized protein n=1 Tax=Exidia glandulosa HHB12029 TaxID=1314781 RepID=A0A165C4S9_EXIGL|nr:hypothetical protein EXIGLDRAFT_779314 [Exidia glandulosa HHB12029]